jgi:hypothetical protein
MAVGANELAARMKRISELTEQLMKMEQENAEAHALAALIHQEIASAREQLRHPAPASEVARKHRRPLR